MSVHQPLERHEALQLAKGFNKFIPLPHVRRWKVHQTDVLHRGTVLSFLRTKSSFFLLPDDISSLKSRQITVTSHGYMVVYEDEDRGLIVNLRAASHVFCTADKYKGFKGPYTRCHIKIRLPRGNIHLFVRDAEIHKWTCAIMKASSSASSPATKIEPIPPIPSTSHHATPCCPTQEDEAITAIEMLMEHREPEFSQSEDCSTSPITIIEHLTQQSPVPQVPTSVRSLRRKLEKELVIKSKDEVMAEQMAQKKVTKVPSFVSELFWPHSSSEQVFSEETKVVLEPKKEEVKEEVEEPKRTPKKGKEWWMTSLRC